MINPKSLLNMRFNLILISIFAGTLVWSGIQPKDYFTWFLEVIPAIVGLLILGLTYRRFQFTKLLYVLMLIHCIILMIGGHYTYAEVPFFDDLKDLFDGSRNNYDKVGHFAQGFVPVMITREIFMRKQVINVKAWQNFILVTIVMGISVTYEFIEWFVAEMTGESAEAFLGTQGYIWDTQADMLYATIGATVALISLSRWHNTILSR